MSSTAKALFLMANPADDAIITASSSEAAFPVTNIQDDRRSRFWRSEPNSLTTLDVEFSASTPVSVFSFVDLNLSTGGKITLTSYSDFIGGTVTFSQTYSPTVYRLDQRRFEYGRGAFGIGPYSLATPLASQRNRQITIIELDAAISDRYWRITFDDPNTVYHQLGRLYMTLPVRYRINLSTGWSARREERSRKKESLGGQRYTQRRDSRLILNGEFRGLSEEDRTNILLAIEEYGEVIPIVFSVFPENTNEGLTTSIYGTLESPSVSNPEFERNNLQFTVVEEF